MHRYVHKHTQCTWIIG